jgi:hypothetical protein
MHINVCVLVSVYMYVCVCMYVCAAVCVCGVPAMSLLENMLDPRTCDSLLRVATKAFICSRCSATQKLQEEGGSKATCSNINAHKNAYTYMHQHTRICMPTYS